WMIPLCSTLLLIFNCIWGKRKYRYIILSVLMWSMLTSLSLQFMQYNIWLIYCLGIPGEIIILLISRLGYLKRKGYQKTEKDSE
ncbi:MAG: hypothetical protein K6E24_03745, partial [bacterium]|nr:hypothetical protein [bacterium]